MIISCADLELQDRSAFNPFSVVYLAVVIEPGFRPQDWLRRLPCPVIAIAGADFAAAAWFDAIVPTQAALAPLVATIERAPIAAATLVQLLRATEHLPVHDALVAESLAYAALQGGAETRAWLAARAPPPVPPAQAGQKLIVERDAGVLSLGLNRPAAFNAIDVTLRDALAEALALAALDESIAEVTLRGTGRCFCAGGAMEEFGLAPDPATAHAIRCSIGPAFRLAAVARKTTARVHGACIGAGAELAALCGRVVAREGAFFQLPEVGFGLLPGSGGTVGVSRRIGRQRTAWLCLSRRRLAGRVALGWGLVDEIEGQKGSVLF